MPQEGEGHGDGAERPREEAEEVIPNVRATGTHGGNLKARGPPGPGAGRDQDVAPVDLTGDDDVGSAIGDAGGFGPGSGWGPPPLGRAAKAAEEVHALEVAQDPAEVDGWYKSSFKFRGRHPIYVLAIQHTTDTGAAVKVVRPNTGESRELMPLGEFFRKYSKVVDLEVARRGWDESIALSEEATNRGATELPPRRLRVALLSGSLTSLWAALTEVVRDQAPVLTRAERLLRTVRVQTTDTGDRVLGVKWPDAALRALTDKLAVLTSAREAAARRGVEGIDLGFGGDSASIHDKAVTKALTSETTLLDFFGRAKAPASSNETRPRPSEAEHGQPPPPRTSKVSTSPAGRLPDHALAGSGQREAIDITALDEDGGRPTPRETSGKRSSLSDGGWVGPMAKKSRGGGRAEGMGDSKVSPISRFFPKAPRSN